MINKHHNEPHAHKYSFFPDYLAINHLQEHSLFKEQTSFVYFGNIK